MSLLDKASLIVTPNAYKTSKLYSVVPNTTLGDMDVVRATTATRVNSAGLIEVVPRNLLTYSEQFENIAWTTRFSTITANSTTAPNGTLTADKLIESVTSSEHWVFQSTTNIIPSATISCYMKKGERNWGFIRTRTTINDFYAWFNLNNGTVGTVQSGITASITDVGNGWYRCVVINPNPTTGANPSVIGVSNADNVFSYLGDGTSGIFIWGAQLEANSTATEYFPTTTRLNIPRIDYTNGSCPSLLVEPQRTNLNLYSEDFGNAYWTLFAATRTLNVVNSPSGIQNADKLIEDNTNSFHSIYLPSNFTVTVGQAYTRTIYAKADGRNWISLLIVDSSQYRAFFDLQNGVIGNISSGITAKITNAGNGWYRCEITRVAATVSLSSMAIELAISNGTGSYLGNGTSGVYLWGAQLELGSYATSYIPTVASTVTRNADVISKTGISSLIGQTEGTLFIEADNKILGQTNRTLFFLSDTTANNLITVNYSAAQANTIRFFVVANGAAGAITFIINTAPLVKIAVTYKNGINKIFINGSLIYTQTGASFSSNLAELYLGTNRNINEFIGERINSFQMYKTELTNTECITLTTL